MRVLRVFCVSEDTYTYFDLAKVAAFTEVDLSRLPLCHKILENSSQCWFSKRIA